MHIQVERDRINNLLDDMHRGSIAVPLFQRDFVWSSKEIVDFYDSILRGWPIGSLLLWVPDTEQFKTLDEIEGVLISQNNNSEVQYVLDGRQRLTSLLSVLLPTGKFAQKLFVDLDEMSVLFSNSFKSSPNYISITDAFDTFTLVDYLERLRSAELPDEQKRKYAERAKDINKTFASYEIGYIVVYGGNIDEAVQIFSRLNSKSTTISPDYMIQALSYTPDNNFLFARKISEIQEKLTMYNLQDIKRDVILKCAYNYTNKPFIDAKAENLYSLGDKLVSIMDDVETDIMAAGRFLSNECGVIDSKLLPYTYQFIMCALYFRYNKNKSGIKHDELKKWFFYTTYASYFTNTSLGNIREDLGKFEAFCKGDSEMPMDYENRIMLSAIPDYSSLNAVRNCAFVLSIINKSVLVRKTNQFSRRLFLIYPSFVEQRSIDKAIICCGIAERNEVRKFLKNPDTWNAEFGKKFNITSEMRDIYKQKDYVTFEKMYARNLRWIEQAFLASEFPQVKLW